MVDKGVGCDDKVDGNGCAVGCWAGDLGPGT